MFLDDQPSNLAVVEVHPGVLERIPNAFLKVVTIASSSIRGIEMQLRLQRT